MRILTLHSNPITLPNWIGCVRCSDRIRALKRAQGLRSSGDLWTSISDSVWFVDS